MQFSKLKRFFKASALLALAAMTLVSLAPISRAQEVINLNRTVLNFPGGLGGTATAFPGNYFGGAAGTPTGFVFPLANNGTGSNSCSDVVVFDFNGDGNQDIFYGSQNSDEIAGLYGRGNGSFVPATLGTAPNGNFSASGGVAATATTGRVMSLAAVNPGTFAGFGKLGAAIDYPAGAFNDVLVFLNYPGTAGGFGQTPTNVVASLDGAAGVGTADPVSIAVGSLNTVGGTDVAVLCSGQRDNVGVTGGWLGIDLSANGTLNQIIGGGTAGGGAVVNEVAGATSGSFYDMRANGGTPGPNPNVYFGVAGAPNARRAFTVKGGRTYNQGIAPRAVTFLATAHLDQSGSNGVAFVATDFGSVGNGAIAINGAPSAPSKGVGEGACFVLLNDLSAAGGLLRNGRQLNEAYDYTNPTVPNGFAQQDGVILRAGTEPSGVAAGDFNGDNKNDICVSNHGSGNVGVFTSGNILQVSPLINPLSTATVTSYPLTQTSFISVGGSPNTVYVRDLNNDGRLDILGTTFDPTLVFTRLYALFGNQSPAGTFTIGTISGAISATSGSTRALAVAATPINGVNGVPANFNGGLADIVTTNGGSAAFNTAGVRIRYGSAVGATSATFTTTTLSSFVGIEEGKINGDNRPDVAIVDRGADQVVVVLNAGGTLGGGTGTGTVFLASLGDFFPQFEDQNLAVTGGLSSLAIGDVDRNNTRDIVVTADGSNDQAIVLYNVGGLGDFDGRFTIRSFPVGGDPTAVKLVDLAGPAAPGTGTSTAADGAPEIIALNRRSNTMTTLINNGAGIFGQGKVAETGGFDPLSDTVADFDDDGNPDVAIVNRGRRNVVGTGEEDDSVVSVLFGNGDGSFQLRGVLIPVPRNSIAISAAGYGIWDDGVQVDIPDINGDGRVDLAVASRRGGGRLPAGITNPDDAVDSQEAPSVTLLFGSTTQPGQFTKSTSSLPLTDTVRNGGAVAIYPGAIDVRDGRLIGYSAITITADYNQNGEPDIHVAGRERNNGGFVGFFAPGGFVISVENNFAGSITALDNLRSNFAASRTYNIFPSLGSLTGLPGQASINAINPIDVDTSTGCAVAGSFVISKTGTIVGQDVNDFDTGAGQIVPDVAQCTSIGRLYESINVASVLNHVPIVTTSKGLADFGPFTAGPAFQGQGGRKVIMNEGEERKITLRAGDVDPSGPGSLRFRLVTFPNFVSMVDNNNGTATITIKPGLTDGSATANNGLGQAYEFVAEVNDQDFRDPLSGRVFFRIFVKDKPTAPTLVPISDQTVNATQSLQVNVDATDATNRTLSLSTNFTAPFSTFTDNKNGSGSFVFKPQEADAGTYNIQVTATNDLGLSSQTSFKLTVFKNTAPTLATIADITVNETEIKDTSVTATDPDVATQNQTLKLAISGPGFVAFTDLGNGKGSIRVAPALGDKGSYTVTVTATDNGFPNKSATTTFKVTVNPTVRITAASYSKKRLFIAGFGFGTSPTVSVNGKAVSAGLVLAGSTDNSITAKGNKASLGLRKGSNTIQVTGVSGQKSNSYTLNLASDEE